MFACIAFSCPNLEVMEISTSEAAVNRITGLQASCFLPRVRAVHFLFLTLSNEVLFSVHRVSLHFGFQICIAYLRCILYFFFFFFFFFFSCCL
uniref:Uncharacterized protein n=1 Tax=Salix viminalis TaxID=40686 RepID=A0A6N2KEX2_SALVM